MVTTFISSHERCKQEVEMVENVNFKNSSHFLLLKTMLEEHDYRALLSVNLPVVNQCNHGCWVHRFTLIELEVAELAEKPLHHTIDVLLESVHLALGHNLLEPDTLHTL